MQKFLFNLGIAVLYVMLTFVLAYINIEFVCGFTLACTADSSEQQLYLLAGQIIMFMNLWAAFFFVNINFFRDGAVAGKQIVRPVITSTLLAAIVFVTAIYIMTVAGFIFVSVTGVNL